MPPTAKKLKYLRTLFMSDRKMECGMDSQLSAASAVMQPLYWTVKD